MATPGMEICGRLYVLLMAAFAMTASVFTIFSCQMFSYRTIDGGTWEGFDPPFDTLSTASVGLFSYSELTTIATSTQNVEKVLFGEECLKYDDWMEAGHNIYFSVAQWCAMIAPCMAFLAWIQVFFDMCCCRLKGGFILISLCFFFAGALQGCTFLVFSDSQFCFEPESVNKCAFKQGSWYSLGAAVAYLVLALISPCLPINAEREEVRGCCIVKSTPKPKEPEEEPPKDESEPQVELEDEETTDMENGQGEEEKEEEEGTGFCGIDFDNLCGPKVEDDGNVEVEVNDPEAPQSPAAASDTAEAPGSPETPASPEAEAPAAEAPVTEEDEDSPASPAAAASP